MFFIPAGTLAYWRAWVLLLVFAGASAALTVYLAKKDPALLERRMRAGPTAEKQGAQKVIMTLAVAGFTALLVFPALDHRFGWSPTPWPVSLLGDLLVILSYVGFFFVFRENTYTAATVEVAEGQTVISTGPYAIVRHPMYASALFLVAGIPLALGSWLGLLGLLVLLPILMWRLLDEEAFLVRNLPGYSDYRRRVRFRLAPLVW